MSGISYSIVSFLALIIFVVLYYDFFSRLKQSEEFKEYRRYLIAVFLYYVSDIVWGMLNHWPASTEPFQYVNTLFYDTVLAASMVFCCRYVVAFLGQKQTRVGRALNAAALVIFSLEVLTLIVNCFVPMLFWFDEQGVYQTGVMRIVAFVAHFAMFIAIIALSLSSISRTQGETRKRNIAISWFGIIIVLSMIAQSFNAFMPFFSMGMLVSTLVIYVFVLQEKEIEYERAEAANKAKTSFLFSMSHDIRTPMNAIKGFSDMLEKYQDDPVRRADYLAKIQTSNRVLLSIINNVLEMARIEKGAISLNEEVWASEQFDDTVPDLEGKRVLLAEDNMFNAEIATDLLEDMGLKVEHAYDGQNALEMLEQAEPGHYDIILMDVQMPRLNGYEATRAIRALADPAKAGIPIVALTASAFDEDRHNALAAGMDGHMAKPLSVAELQKTLIKYTGQPRP